MRIVLTADHAGVDLKDELAAWLREQGHDVLDLGTNGHESVDYPRYGAMLAEALADGRAERGISRLRVRDRRRHRRQPQSRLPLRAGRRAAVGDACARSIMTPTRSLSARA